MIDGGFSVVNIFVNYESGAASVFVCSDSDLTNCTVFAKYIVHFFAGDVEWKVADVEDAVNFRWESCVSFPETDCCHGWLLTVVLGG
ncbi:RNA-binding (RRM/RBD/RNP motifs) family protein [Trifolium repens]|nr:RNA-binding (RRM/RBD/RNP motifs) family protein [Trifolium repens]